MREKLSDYQEEYGDLYNLEATPAESTSYRLAKKDKELYPDIITASDDNTPYYTNSSHLPVGFTSDVFEALDIQDGLQTLYTSGTVFHVFLGERMPDWKSCANLVKKVAENYKLPYYTISPTYSVCKNHGYITGEVYKCPICGEETEVYSRITGYYRPVKNWNDGKSKEFEMRKEYDMCNSEGHFERKDDNKNECKPKKAAEILKKEINDGLLLFGTKTCPNCKMAKKLLEKANMTYEFVDAEELVDMTKEYNIKKAPTLVVINGDSRTNIENVSNIKKFIEDYSK
jgi:ribonucleoside-triphosphate reductase